MEICQNQQITTATEYQPANLSHESNIQSSNVWQNLI